MFNTKFILEDRTEVFPTYLDNEARSQMKERYKGKRQYMKCGCRPEAQLFYRISEDLRIYPEHNNYQHDIYCSRYRDEEGKKVRQTAYVIDEETGNVTAYISFDPKEFDLGEAVEREKDNIVPEEDEAIEEIIVEQEDAIKPEAKKREPKLTLQGLVRGINVDTFTEKVLTGKQIASAEAFQKMVFYRMKKVFVDRTKRAIGDLTLEKDGVRFIYLPFAGSSIEESNGFKKCYLQTKGADGKIYQNFTYPEVLEKALTDYAEQYGTEPNPNTMLAAFQYLKKGRNGSAYRVLGRIHLHEVSDVGLYCNSLTEQFAFNYLQELTSNNKDIKYWIPPEDKSIGAIVEIKGYDKKLLVLFKGDKSNRVSFDKTMYVPFVVGSETILNEAALKEALSNA